MTTHSLKIGRVKNIYANKIRANFLRGFSVFRPLVNLAVNALGLVQKIILSL